MNMKLEVVVLGVSDVDRAKAFYEKLGGRVDADFVKGEDFRDIAPAWNMINTLPSLLWRREIGLRLKL